MPPFAIDPENDTVCDVIRRWAEIQPDAPAIIADGKPSLTYRDVVDAMDHVRAILNASGIGRGDRVGIVHSDRIEVAVINLGVLSGATAIPLDPRQTGPEFAKKLVEAHAAAVIVGPDVSHATMESARGLGLTVIQTRPSQIGGGGGFEDWISPAGTPEDAGKRSGPARRDDIAIALATSGTTERSKIVPSSHKRVLACAQQRQEAYGLGPGDVGSLVRPLYYSAGINSFLESLYAGSAIVVLPGFEAKQFFRCAAAHGVTWYNGGPALQKAIHAHLTEFPEAARGLSMRHIRQVSSYLEPEIIDDIERMLEAPVTIIYSTSETGAIAVSCPGAAPRRLVPTATLPDRLGFGKCEVRTRSLDGRFLPVGERGEVVVRGPQVFDGYENDVDANEEAFVDGWFRTGDEGVFDADGTLALTGRIKEVINRGGEKVSPVEVDAALLGHPDVRDAATFPLRHPTLGEEVAAAVVQAPGAGLTDQVLTRYLLGRLTGFKVPRRFYFVPEIPKSDAGKLQRYKLAEALGVDADIGTHGAGVSDREATPLEAQLGAIWARALRIPEVGLDDNFFMLGGDSLQAVELFLLVEKELDRRLSRAILFEAGTVAEMARRIEDLTPSPCLVPIQPKGDKPPFFCVHDGNGEVLNYRGLARLVGEAQPFYGIQCRGLDGEDIPFTRIGDMAAHYVGEIRKVQPAGPYFLGGYSFGGRVAYVMAQQLRAAGEEVALLALLDTNSGYGQRRVTLRDWFAHHRERLRELSLTRLPAYFGLRVSNLVKMVYMGLRQRCFSAALRFFERRARPIPRILRRPVLANDIIRREYKPRTYAGNATLFKAERYAWTHADAHQGWRDLVKGRLEIRPIPGRHYEIVRQPHVQDLAAELAGALDRAQAASAVPAGPAAKDGAARPK